MRLISLENKRHKMEHTVRFSIWSSPRGFGGIAKDNYSAKLKNVFCKNFNSNKNSYTKVINLILCMEVLL